MSQKDSQVSLTLKHLPVNLKGQQIKRIVKRASKSLGHSSPHLGALFSGALHPWPLVSRSRSSNNDTNTNYNNNTYNTYTARF